MLFPGKEEVEVGRHQTVFHSNGFSKINQPCLVFASRGDTTDPFEGCEYLFNQLGSKSKQFILLGVDEGFAKDYDHVGMVIDKSAQQEVWPLILSWLK